MTMTNTTQNITICIVAGLMSTALISLPAAADVVTAKAANVSPNSVALVWTFDEAVLSATVRTYTDASATNEVTGLDVEVQSADAAQAHTLGVVMVRVAGLDPDSNYYFQLDTTTAGGGDVFPASGAGLMTRTAVRIDRESQLNPGVAISNDTLTLPVSAPDGTAPVDSILTLLEVPGAGQSPLAAFARTVDLKSAALNLNNLFDAAGRSYEVPDGTALQVTHWRGLLCDAAEQETVSYRRTRTHPEVPRVATADPGVACYGSDTVCDGVLNVLDFQYVLGALDAVVGDCAYAETFDSNLDLQIDAADYQPIIDRLDDVEPF